MVDATDTMSGRTPLDTLSRGEWSLHLVDWEGHPMHALGRYVQELMDARGMTRTELVQRSGLSKQLVSRLLTTPTLSRMVEPKTIEGLARAFPDVGERPFITKAAEAIGVPVDRLVTVDPDLDSISDETLVGLLAKRLKQRHAKGVVGDESATPQESAPMNQAGAPPAGNPTPAPNAGQGVTVGAGPEWEVRLELDPPSDDLASRRAADAEAERRRNRADAWRDLHAEGKLAARTEKTAPEGARRRRAQDEAAERGDDEGSDG